MAPTWRPARYDLESQASRNVLAYVDIEDRLRAVDVDSGKRLADLQLAARPISIHWLSRERVLIASPDQVQMADTESGTAETAYTPAPSAGAIVGVDGYPGGSKAAVLVTTKADGQDEARSRLVLIDTEGDRRPRTAFSGLGHFDGPLLSPNGTRAQLGWRDAGQWLFVPTDRTADVIAVDNIPRQFDSGGGESDPLPRIESWCCR